MTRTHSARASRRLPHLPLLLALAFAASVLAACTDSPVDPRATSPVGRYELVGCTWGADTVAAHIETGCGTGGSGRHDWPSGSVLISEDSTVTRTLVEIFSTPGSPIPYSTTDTGVVVGRWSLDGREVKAAWNGFSYAATTVFTRADRDLIRENDVWNEYIYFWYRRTP